MKNSLALVVTESDVQHIRNIYKAPIVEQTVILPLELKDETGVKSFQDWMDKTYPNWITNKRGKKVSLNQGTGYGNYGKNTEKAWGDHKDEYLKSLQAANSADTTKYAYDDGGTASKYMTREELDKLIEDGTITADTYIYTKAGGWQKGKSMSSLDFGAPAPPQGPNAIITTTTTKAPNGSMVDNLYGDRNAKPSDVADPLANIPGGTKPDNLQGFKDWYKETYRVELKADPIHDEKRHTMTVIDGSKKLVFSYNDTLKTWNPPQEMNAEQGTTKITTGDKDKVTTTQ